MGNKLGNSKKSVPFVRSYSFRGSQRCKYMEFDVQLFKIEMEIRGFKERITKAQVSGIKEKLYKLRKDFDNSRLKEKYDAEFRTKYRRIIDVLDNAMKYRKDNRVSRRNFRNSPSQEPIYESVPQFTSSLSLSERRRSRKKYRAPLPPQQSRPNTMIQEAPNKKELIRCNTDILHTHDSSKKVDSLWSQVVEIEKDINIFQAPREGKRCYLKEILDRCMTEAEKIDTDDLSYIANEKKQLVERIEKLSRELDRKIAESGTKDVNKN